MFVSLVFEGFALCLIVRIRSWIMNVYGTDGSIVCASSAASARKTLKSQQPASNMLGKIANPKKDVLALEQQLTCC